MWIHTDTGKVGSTNSCFIENRSSIDIQSWEIEFDTNFEIYEYWCFDIDNTDQHYKFTSLSWNGAINAGQSIEIGFNAYNPVTINSIKNVKINGTSINFVLDVPGPEILLEAESETIVSGEKTKLSWDYGFFNSYFIDNGVGTIFDTEVTVQPTSTTTYTITGSGPGGDASDSITITVRPRASVELSADNPEILAGESTVLRWESLNAISLFLDDGTGARPVTGSSLVVTPEETTTYTILAEGEWSTGSDSVTVTVRPRVSVELSADNPEILAGESTVLRWEPLNAVSLFLDDGSGAVSVTGSSLVVAPEETTTYVIIAEGEWSSAFDSVTITVRPRVSVELSADNPEILVGESTVLRWESLNADSLSIDDGAGAVPVTGSFLVVTPAETTTYTILAEGEWSSASDSVTVTVAAGVSVDLSADNQEILAGESTVLRWEALNAVNLSLDDGAGAVPVTGNSLVVSPAGTTTYTIIAEGELSSASDSVTITVRPRVSVALSVDHPEILAGESTVLRWEALNADSLSMDDGTGAVPVSGSSLVVTPAETTTYTILAEGEWSSASDSVTVTVAAGVSVDLSADNQEILAGESTVLRWEAFNAVNLSLDDGTGAVPVSGSSLVVTPAETTTYTIFAEGEWSSASDSVTVTVVAGVSVDLSADNQEILAGESTVLRWEALNAVNLSLDDGTGAVPISGNSLVVTPAATTTYTILAEGELNSASDSVTIIVRPRASVALSADSQEILAGESTVLRWEAFYAVNLSLDDGTGAVPVSGSSLVVTPVETTTYTITAEGELNSASDSITITVRPRAIVALSADNQEIPAGESTVLRWEALNAVNIFLDDGAGAVPISGNSLVVTPAETTTYTIFVEGEWNSASDSITVIVTQGAILDLTADNETIINGEYTILRWNIQNAVSMILSDGVDNIEVSGTSLAVNPDQTTTYTLYTESSGTMANDSVTITVRPGVKINFSADNTVIAEGEQATLRWETENAISMTLYDGTGGVGVTGTSLVVSPDRTKTFTLYAEGEWTSAFASVTVEVGNVELTDYLAYWPFEEVNDIILHDLSENMFDGLYVVNPEWIDGTISNYALNFTADNGYIIISNDGSFDTEIFTVSTWMTHNGLPETGSMATYFRHVNKWHLMSMNGTLQMGYVDENDIEKRIDSGYAFTDNSWHHYAVTVNNNDKTVNFFVDGNNVSGPLKYEGFDANYDFSWNILIGQYDYQSQWNGAIDDVRFYNRILNSSEIKALYNW